MSNTVYPLNVDSPTNPTANGTLGAQVHHLIEGLQNDAVVQLETKLGTGSSNQIITGANMFLVSSGAGASQWVSTLTSPSITTSLLDTNAKTWLGQTAINSAVNYVNIANAATGGTPAISAAGTDTNINLNLVPKGSGKVQDNGSNLIDFRSSFANFVVSGGTWSIGSGLQGSMTAINLFINGVEYSVAAVSNHTFAASSDTYVDYTVGTGITYTAVANNAASPSLAANSVRIAKVITSGAAITSIVQTSNNDSLGTEIRPVGAVGPSQLSTGAQAAYVPTSETTTSNTYADLPTTTDTVTVMIGANGLALVAFGSSISNNGNDAISNVSFAVSGATSIAAGLYAQSAQQVSTFPNHIWQYYSTVLVTGLNTGATTFKMKYSVGSGTGSFVNRRIAVVPL